MLYDEVRAQFAEKELVDLTLSVIAINAWNRLGVTFRPAVGSYQPAVNVVASARRQSHRAIDSDVMREAT